MRPHQRQLFLALATPVLALPDCGFGSSLRRLLQPWIAAGPAPLSGEDRVIVEAICRIIDVRKQFPAGLNIDGKLANTREPPDPLIMAGLVALLLANASANLADRGWRFKCANTALKALDLAPNLPEHPALLAWALESIERDLPEDVRA